LPFLIQLMLFATPIIYPVSMIPERYQWLMALNPLSALIAGFRYVVAPSGSLDWSIFGISIFIIVAIFVTGMVYFRSAERAMADIV
jgi:lipopolysaccharide transport system permease protein